MRSVAALIALGGLTALSCAAAGEVVPIPGAADSRIQWADYAPDDVVVLQIVPGFQVTVGFEPGERITSVALGDAGAWQAMPNRSADYLFVKAKQMAMDTNLTVITDRRAYSFLLTQQPSGVGPPFMVRFRYPADAPPPPAATSVATRYALSGATTIRPSRIWDDGVRTYIQWAVDSALPAVFARQPTGEETLVNGAVRDGIFTIDAVADTLIFRRGKASSTARRLSVGTP